MNSKILITALFGFIFIACFSQENQKMESDSTALNFNSIQKDTTSLDSRTNKQLDVLPEIENKFKVPELNFLPESDFNANRALSENKNSFDYMPTYKPRINDNMPVAVPDSTIDYKLKIKKYNGGTVKPNTK